MKRLVSIVIAAIRDLGGGDREPGRHRRIAAWMLLAAGGLRLRGGQHISQ